APLQGPGCQHRPMPGPKVLGREVLARDPPQVVVDGLRSDRPWLARTVQVPEDGTSTGQREASSDQSSQAEVGDGDAVLRPGLPTESKADRVSPHLDVARAQGGQPERSVLPNVLIVAHPDERGLEELNDQRYDGVPRKPAPTKV